MIMVTSPINLCLFTYLHTTGVIREDKVEIKNFVL